MTLVTTKAKAWGEKWVPNIRLERSWNVNIKRGSYFPFGVLNSKLWPKVKFGVKFATWLLIWKTKKIKAKWHPNWTSNVTLELFSKGYNFAFMSFSIRFCMQELWAHKIMGFIPWIKLGIFWIPLEFETWEFFYHFDATPTTSHKICYMKRGGGFSPSLGHGVSC